MPKSIVIQLARLGDLMQSAPALLALSNRAMHETVDVLCADPLVSLARCLPGVERAIGWDGLRWQRFAKNGALSEAGHELQSLAPDRYEVAYNLNQHNRAKLAAHLLADRVIGPGEFGPINANLPRWAAYLHDVARSRGENRVHLSDTWCGFCGVRPSGQAPRLKISDVPSVPELSDFSGPGYMKIAVAVGAGDSARMLPVDVVAELLRRLLSARTDARVVLVGSRGEREVAAGIERRLDPLLATRVWNITGRTSLLELANVLSACTWVLGADTGPLHLATMVGARAVGLYFARARVHETGPYGAGHWVWQAESPRLTPHPSRPTIWPIEETITLISTGRATAEPEGWQLWLSDLDEYGAQYHRPLDMTAQPDSNRRRVWERLSEMPLLSAESCVGEAS